MFIRFDKGSKYSSIRASNTELTETSDSLDGFDDAGYVLTKHEVVVDIDDLDKSTIDSMIKFFNIQTQIVWTDRGAHLYYKKPPGFKRAKGHTALGFQVEYKTDSNTKATTIKRNGVKREVVNEGIREPLPDFFKPDKKYQLMLGMGEGDGRNDALHKHKFRISRLNQPERILEFINKYIFEKPLENKEFETLSRPEEMQITGQDDEYFAATIIMNEINPVVYGDKIYFYRDNHYINDDRVLRRVITDMFPGFKTRYTDEVIKQIEYRAPLTPPYPRFKIKFKNGYLDNGRFINADYTDFTPYYIDLKYDPDAKPVQIVDDYLDNLSDGDPEYKRFIIDIFGHCLITDPKVKRSISKFFIFIGNGGEGKGTFLDVVGSILGEENCSRVSIDDIDNEKYYSTLDGKLANLGDDQENAPINGKQMKKLKNLATADTVSMRNLYENPRVVRPTATLIFTTNYLNKSHDKDESYKRRVLWCPMRKKPDKMIGDFFDQITTPECLSYWIKLAVEGYMRIYENGLEVPEKVKMETHQYFEENDSCPLFVEGLADEEIEGKRSPQIYDQYEIWAEDNGEPKLSLKHMIKTIREMKGYEIKVKRIDGVLSRVFTKIEED